MIDINIEKMSGDDLKSYNDMMNEAALKIAKISSLAVSLWSAVLK
jgi:hypothetical protein